jgi:hypothetical protein
MTPRSQSPAPELLASRSTISDSRVGPGRMRVTRPLPLHYGHIVWTIVRMFVKPDVQTGGPHRGCGRLAATSPSIAPLPLSQGGGLKYP